MRGREKRFGIATLLTALDALVFHRYGGIIWQDWSGVPSIAAAILVLLFIWVWSIVVMWMHVYVDLQHLVEERRHLALRIPRDVREGPNV